MSHVSSLAGGDKKAINQALWLECAGPLITLPAIGSQVVYFPQGHSEQVIASTHKEADFEVPSYPNLPPQLFCILHNITLHADQENDEVFAQMTLQPFSQTALLKDPFLLPDFGIQTKQTIVSFSKTLTASDTSTHGGFSIPRRAAEKVFPPLDFTKTPPAQELVARDLHNNEWHFRHIYRGQPRRHLLTTGWSVFVSAKRLQAGDTVLFLRDEQGQHMLGIRRANRQQTNLPTSLLSSDSMLIGVLAAAAHAASTNSRFTIFYNPRASPSEFVIPLAKYQKALHPPQLTVGMRFRMEMETEDSSTRRYMGTITGIGDLDPVRWPNSHWRSLKVRALPKQAESSHFSLSSQVGWDESTAGQKQRRVSAWEIEPLTVPFLLCNSSFLLRSKRPREEELQMKAPSIWARGEEGKFSMQNMNFPGLSGMDHWLQLQQKAGGSAAVTPPPPVIQPGYYSSILQEMRTIDATPKQLMQSPQAFQPMQFNQSMPPLLQQQQQQAQQMMHLPPNVPEAASMHAPYIPAALKTPPDQEVNRNSNSYPPFIIEDGVSYTSMLQGSAPASLPKQQHHQQQAGMLTCSSLDHQTNWMPSLREGDASIPVDASLLPPSASQQALDQDNDPRSHVLFGVNIDGQVPPSYAPPPFSKPKDFSGAQADIALLHAAEENGVPQPSWPQQVYPPPVRTFTKVHKVGSVGRSLDITRFKNYHELRNELTRMFGLEHDHKSGWQLVFIDNENDMLLLGDDPWDEFIGCVKSIRILSSSEILQMNQEHMEWLNSIPLHQQQKQASSSSDDHRPCGDVPAITTATPTAATTTTATTTAQAGNVPRAMSSYNSDPSCVSDGI
ncbi:auxin response factor 16 isoform X3 [Selaginella moellendorffii]|uniref:auxin response factor 16 isoform X3 n=1 Tax=Selaginella moellendorffii TaxID=88036 RepID=UPI000D1CDB7E|nr:auxin response factor 16 isoform X3 [Selaginella moellendorffii]|eukprot:XP_024514790.1 auxin response factor 16 isoform X3 [Selaginella moellendorffii]